MEQLKTNENKIDRMLEAVYGHGHVPQGVNVRLQNRLKCKSVIQGNSISVWWLPAFLSTVMAVAGFVITFTLYLVVNLDEFFIMPNLVHMISNGLLKMQLIGMIIQITASWLITVIGLWKMNFYYNAHIF